MPTGRALVASILERAAERIPSGCRPLSAETSVFAVAGVRGDAVGIFAPHVSMRPANVAVTIAPGSYVDLWSGDPVKVGADRTFVSDSPDGIALLTSISR